MLQHNALSRRSGTPCLTSFQLSALSFQPSAFSRVGRAERSEARRTQLLDASAFIRVHLRFHSAFGSQPSALRFPLFLPHPRFHSSAFTFQLSAFRFPHSGFAKPLTWMQQPSHKSCTACVRSIAPNDLCKGALRRPSRPELQSSAPDRVACCVLLTAAAFSSLASRPSPLPITSEATPGPKDWAGRSRAPRSACPAPRLAPCLPRSPHAPRPRPPSPRW